MISRLWIATAVIVASSGCDETGSGGSDAGAAPHDAGGIADAAAPRDAGPGPDAGPSAADAGAVCGSGVELGAPIDAPAREWTWVDVPGSRCMDGSSTGIGVNVAPESDRVVIYFEGGGACFDFWSCLGVAHDDGFDEATFERIATAHGSDGLFDRDDPDNPLADWSYVFIPYCSGDYHGGDRPMTESGRVHVGYRNVERALRRLVPTFADARQVLVTGSSAGGLGATINYTQIAEAFGCARVDMVNDAGPILGDAWLRSCMQERIRERFGMDPLLAELCPECLDPEGDGLIEAYAVLAARYPDRRVAQLAHVHDAVVRLAFGYNRTCTLPGQLPRDEFEAGLLDLRAQLSSTPNFYSFYAEGSAHIFLDEPLTESVAGDVTLAQWLTELVGDAPPTAPHAGP